MASCNQNEINNTKTLYIALRYDVGPVNKEDKETNIFHKYKYRTLQSIYNKDSVNIKEHDDILFIRNSNLWKVKMFNTFYKHPKLLNNSFLNYFYCLPIEESDNYKFNIDVFIETTAIQSKFPKAQILMMTYINKINLKYSANWKHLI